MKKMRWFALALVLPLALAGCGPQESGPAQAKVRDMPARTETVAVDKTAVYHSAPASVVAEERVELASRLMGHIRAIAVTEGQAVSRGQLLFSVDPVDVQGQVEQARLAVQLAEDAWKDSKADLERYTNLFREEVVSRQQVEKIQLAHAAAASRLAQARAGLHTASGQLRYATVTSPIAGVVTRKLADVGDMATPGQPVLVVETTGKLQAETQVPEAVFKGLRLGERVAVAVDGRAEPIEGRIARLSPSADPVSRTFPVKLDLSGPGLRSGAFARVLFPIGEREALTVPAAAVIDRAGIAGVFVAGADSLARFRMLRTGEVRDGRVEVLSGLSAGERVVVEGAERLESGDRIVAPASRPAGE